MAVQQRVYSISGETGDFTTPVALPNQRVYSITGEVTVVAPTYVAQRVYSIEGLADQGILPLFRVYDEASNTWKMGNMYVYSAADSAWLPVT